MSGRSAPGSSTPTSRFTDRLPGPRLLYALVGIPAAGFYVFESFAAPDPILRIALRSLPVLPVAIWTLWFDAARPFTRRRPAVRLAARLALLIVVLAFAVAVLGFGLNWLYDPNRVV